jgi:hypothetical protein
MHETPPFSQAGGAACFQMSPSISSLRPGAFSALSSPKSFARLQSLRMLDEAAVTKNMDLIAEGKAPKKAPNALYKALVKRSGAVSAGIECSRAADDTESLSTPDAVDFRQFGMKMRRSKVGVVLVDCSTGGGMEDCEMMVKEQLTAKGSFPGPVPVVRSGTVSSVRHIAEAQAMGVSGVLLSECDEELIKACNLLGIEAIVRASSAQQVEQAVAAGATLIACDADVRDSVPKDVGAIGLVASRVEDPASFLSVAASEKDEIPTPQASLPKPHTLLNPEP